jgi:hypothetical protein
VLAWLWLDVAAAVVERGEPSAAADIGRLAALDYFMRYELPRTDAWLQVVESRDRTCRDIPEDAF